jgi:Skp family chaperone for outer membrane proteins
MPAHLRRRLLGVLLLVAAAMVPAVRLEAQQAAPTVILIVDMQQILQDAKAAKEVQAALNQQYTAYSKQVAQQEDELQKGGAELESKRTALSPDVYHASASALQQRYDELGKTVQAKRQALQQSLNDAMGKVRAAALEVVADVSKERRATLVLEKQAVVYESEGMDISAEAIVRLDKKLPSVTINLPSADDGGLKPPPKN